MADTDEEKALNSEHKMILRELAAKKIWRTREGKQIPVKEMTDDHIQNALAMLRRAGAVGPREMMTTLLAAPPNGDMAQYAWEAEIDYVSSAPQSPWIDIFLDEIKRRGLKEKET